MGRRTAFSASSPGIASNSLRSRLQPGRSQVLRNQSGTYNVFRGQPARAANGVDNASVVWAGIPIVAPGTNNTRTFRITNIRANATSVPASASLVPSQIFAFISISASQSLALNNPQQAVAFVLPGLQFDVRNCEQLQPVSNQTFLQCVSRNSDLANNPGSAGPFSEGVFGVRFREGFQIRPGAYPWPNHHNAWRRNHIHFSSGPAFATRLVTQMYSPATRCWHSTRSSMRCRTKMRATG